MKPKKHLDSGYEGSGAKRALRKQTSPKSLGFHPARFPNGRGENKSLPLTLGSGLRIIYLIAFLIMLGAALLFGALVFLIGGTL